MAPVSLTENCAALSVHVDQETIERMAEGKLSEPDLSIAEEHCLVCHRCQDALKTASEYAAAMKAALRQAIAEQS